MKKLYGSWN